MAQHTANLPQALVDVADRAQDKGRNDGVEGSVVERQRRGIPLDEGHLVGDETRAASREREGRGADVDAVDDRAGRVDGEVRSGPDADLQDVASGAADDTGARMAEAEAISQAHPQVEQAGCPNVPDLQARGGGTGSEEPVARQVPQLHQNGRRHQLAPVTPAEPRRQR
jgi:hypothetical protein